MIQQGRLPPTICAFHLGLGLDAISLEHRVREGDFIQLARLSPIVPPGRDRLYGKLDFVQNLDKIQ